MARKTKYQKLFDSKNEGLLLGPFDCADESEAEILILGAKEKDGKIVAKDGETVQVYVGVRKFEDDDNLNYVATDLDVREIVGVLETNNANVDDSLAQTFKTKGEDVQIAVRSGSEEEKYLSKVKDALEIAKTAKAAKKKATSTQAREKWIERAYETVFQHEQRLREENQMTREEQAAIDELFNPTIQRGQKKQDEIKIEEIEINQNQKGEKKMAETNNNGYTITRDWVKAQPKEEHEKFKKEFEAQIEELEKEKETALAALAAEKEAKQKKLEGVDESAGMYPMLKGEVEKVDEKIENVSAEYDEQIATCRTDLLCADNVLKLIDLVAEEDKARKLLAAAESRSIKNRTQETEKLIEDAKAKLVEIGGKKNVRSVGYDGKFGESAEVVARGVKDAEYADFTKLYDLSTEESRVKAEEAAKAAAKAAEEKAAAQKEKSEKEYEKATKKAAKDKKKAEKRARNGSSHPVLKTAVVLTAVAAVAALGIGTYSCVKVEKVAEPVETAQNNYVANLQAVSDLAASDASNVIALLQANADYDNGVGTIYTLSGDTLSLNADAISQAISESIAYGEGVEIQTPDAGVLSYQDYEAKYNEEVVTYLAVALGNAEAADLTSTNDFLKYALTEDNGVTTATTDEAGNVSYDYDAPYQAEIANVVANALGLDEDQKTEVESDAETTFEEVFGAHVGSLSKEDLQEIYGGSTTEKEDNTPSEDPSVTIDQISALETSEVVKAAAEADTNSTIQNIEIVSLEDGTKVYAFTEDGASAYIYDIDVTEETTATSLATEIDETKYVQAWNAENVLIGNGIEASKYSEILSTKGADDVFCVSDVNGDEVTITYTVTADDVTTVKSIDVATVISTKSDFRAKAAAALTQGSSVGQRYRGTTTVYTAEETTAQNTVVETNATAAKATVSKSSKERTL